MPNDGDLAALPISFHDPAFPKSMGRIGIVDEDAVTELVSRKALPRPWLLGSSGEQALDFWTHVLQGGTEVGEHMCSDTVALDQQPQQQVLSADRVVAHPARFLEGELDHLLDTRSRNDLLDDDSLVSAEDELDGVAYLADLQAQVGQGLSANPVAIAHQAQQEVLGANVAVVRALGLLLGERQYVLGALAEPLERKDGKPSTCRVQRA